MALIAEGLGPYGFSLALSFATPGGGPYIGSTTVEPTIEVSMLPLVELNAGAEAAPAKMAEPPKKLLLPILKI